jgi:hypothetical protein
MWWVRWKPHKDYGPLKAAFQGHDGLKDIKGYELGQLEHLQKQVF